jgi:hypothetical protein
MLVPGMGKTDRLGTGRAPLPKAGWWTESFGCPKRRSGWNAIELMDCEPQLMSGDGRHWAYRIIIDGRECWYPGERVTKGRAPLEAPSAPQQSGVLKQSEVEVSPPEPAPQQPGVVERSEVEGSPRKPTRDRTNVKSFHNPVCQKPATTFERTGMSLKVCGSEIIEPDLSGIRLQPGTPIGRVRRAPKQCPATHIWIRQPA